MHDLRQLVEIRLKEAAVLISAGEYSGAYYLCGYSLECAVKVCILKNIPVYTVPDKKLIDQMHTHRIDTLIELANLKDEFNRERGMNPDLMVSWGIVKDWSETARYRVYDMQTAVDMYTAVSDVNNGVLQWLKNRW